MKQAVEVGGVVAEEAGVDVVLCFAAIRSNDDCHELVVRGAGWVSKSA